MSIFTKIWSGVWSARMEYILNNAILALLDTPGTTLLGITRLLVDKEYRQKIVGNIKDPVVKAFWLNEYEEWKDQFRNEAIAPIQNKVGQFLSTSVVRNIVGQSKSTIDIFDIMNSGKIFIVNVSKGRIGEDNSALLGAMLITKIQLASMERVRVPEDERVDFYLYVDEFQNFATDSFASILSESRKYRLDLILAHQYIGQLVTDVSTKVRDAVFGNVGTMVCFRVGAADAEFLESEFDPGIRPGGLRESSELHHIPEADGGRRDEPAFLGQNAHAFQGEFVFRARENYYRKFKEALCPAVLDGGKGNQRMERHGRAGDDRERANRCFRQIPGGLLLVREDNDRSFRTPARPACLLPGLPRENKGGGIEADSVRPRFCSFTPGSKPAIFRFGRFGHRVRAEGAGIYRSEEREFPADKKSFRSFQTQAGNFPAATLGRFRRKAVYGRNGKTWSFSLGTLQTA